MSASRKPSRKDLKKDDEFVARGREVVAWASAYSRQLVAVAVGIVLIVVIGTATTAVNQRRATQAARALGSALAIAERPVLDVDVQPAGMPGDAFRDEEEKRDAYVQALEEIRAEHRRTPAAALANLYLGDVALELEEYDQAMTHYETFLSEAPRGHKMRFAALEGIAIIHESRGELEQAIDASKELARADNEFYRPFALLRQARILGELERYPEARDAAQQVVDEFAGSDAVRDARDLLSRLPEQEGSAVEDVAEN